MMLQNAVVVITGGGSGIGAAMARRFAREGARAIVVADRDTDAARLVADEIGGIALTVDVTREQDLCELVSQTRQRCGPIDLFCSNAGATAQGGPEVEDEAWERVWRVNVMAHVHAARALLPAMVARGQGHFLQTASAAGLLSQFDAPYAVSKHAAVAFAEWLSITYGDRGIGVSCLCPLGVDTPMLRAEDTQRQALMSPGLLSPDDVAAAVVQGLAENRFLILPHPQVLAYLQRKTADPERWLLGMRRLHAQVGPRWP